MIDLFNTVRTINKYVDSPIILFFSTGKDSIVSGELLFQNDIPFCIVYMYHVPGISYRDEIIDYYSNRWNCKSYQVPYPDCIKIIQADNFAKIKAPKMNKQGISQIQEYLRKNTGFSWVAWGWKITDSLQRRGFIKAYSIDEAWIDVQHKRVFPVADWKDKHVYNYIDENKLKLPIEYDWGFRDINFFINDTLVWLYINYPEDYQKVIDLYPMLEGNLKKNLFWNKNQYYR